MAPWVCAIDGHGAAFDDLAELLVHQASEHEAIECGICGAELPDGYFAFSHAFEEHSRAEYVRAYDADAEAIRRREQLIEIVEDAVDVDRIAERIGIDTDGGGA